MAEITLSRASRVSKVSKVSNLRGVALFYIMSLIGVFSFFISFPFNGNDTFLVNHVVAMARVGLAPVMKYIVYFLGIISLIDLYARRERFFRDGANIFMSVAKMIGFIMLTMVVFNHGPEFLLTPEAGPAVLFKILIPITITVVVAAIFLPFLLDYGLIDFFGVLARPVMRPVFKAPGLSAVIAVSAFLGNFSIGHIAVDMLQKKGRLTMRESVLIGTGFCTVSVGFLMLLSSAFGLDQYWNFYFWSAFIITIVVTIFQARIWPTSTKPDRCLEGCTPNLEKEFKTNLLRNAYNEGINVAQHQKSFVSREKLILKESILVVAAFATGVNFFATGGVLIYQYTPLIQYAAYIFYPILKLVQIPAYDLWTASQACAISFLDFSLPMIVITQGGEEMALATRYVMAVVPVSAIIFLGAFIPCIMSTSIRVSLFELIVIWFERIVITILIAGVVAMLYF
ncbi:YjiH family protein [Desulfosarcina variabilis]|uniref:YjiH family protein n=1 Tax=Desulfosarcina variabilis TaxID=2300 RepID=UPI003AFAD872